MSQIQDSDDIDLVELVQTIWDGKLTIITFVIVSVFSVVGVSFVMPSSSFVATTEIRSVLPNQAELYRLSNSAGIFAVYANEASRNLELDPNRDRDRDGDRNKDSDSDSDRSRDRPGKIVPSVSLQELYIELLGRRHAFREAFKKFSVVNREDYETEREYDVAVARRAASVEILPPVNLDGKNRGEIRENWVVRFEFNDEKKWLDILQYATQITNEEMQVALKSQFKTLLNTEKSKKQFAIEDLKIIRNTLITAYTNETSSKLAFLREQAAIARELNIAEYAAGTPSLEARTFDLVADATSGKRNIISEVTSDEPFYMRGYKSIEKQIELIQSRVEIEPFIDGLPEIDQKINALVNDESHERAEKLFALTPATTAKGFTAASVSVEATEFEYKPKRMKLMIALAFIVGSLVGVIYVLFSKAMRIRREASATTV